MKKIILSFVFIIILTGCTTQKEMVRTNGVFDMIIKRRELTKESQDIVELIGGEAYVFDYRTDETIKSFVLQLWIVEDGEWQSVSSRRQNIIQEEDVIYKEGSIYFYLGETECKAMVKDLYIKSDTEEEVKTSLNVEYGKDRFLDCMSRSSGVMEEMRVVPDKEYILFESFATTENRLEISQDFKENNYDVGLVLTIQFLMR